MPFALWCIEAKSNWHGTIRTTPYAMQFSCALLQICTEMLCLNMEQSGIYKSFRRGTPIPAVYPALDGIPRFHDGRSLAKSKPYDQLLVLLLQEFCAKSNHAGWISTVQHFYIPQTHLVMYSIVLAAHCVPFPANTWLKNN